MFNLKELFSEIKSTEVYFQYPKNNLCLFFIDCYKYLLYGCNCTQQDKGLCLQHSRASLWSPFPFSDDLPSIFFLLSPFLLLSVFPPWSHDCDWSHLARWFAHLHSIFNQSPSAFNPSPIHPILPDCSAG